MTKWTKITSLDKGDVSDAQLAQTGGLKNPEQAERKRAPKFLSEQDVAAVQKDPGMAVDTSPPASPALVGPGFSWHKLPKQKSTTEKKPSPQVVVGGAPPTNTDAFAPVKKDPADTEPTTEYDNTGRPRWMASPGYGGKDPLYVSQKPDGNKDTLFSKNINKNPPPMEPVDPDAYYIW